MYFGERAKQSNEKLDGNFGRNLSSFIISILGIDLDDVFKKKTIA
jgi:hypothetical protein